MVEISQIIDSNLLRISAIFLVLGLTWLIGLIIRRLMHHHVSKSLHILNMDPTQYRFLKNSMSAIIYVIGITIAIFLIPPLKSFAVSLFAGAGILAIILGFASQQAFANIISGIFLVIFKPFRVGDRIKIGTDIRGYIEDITLRHTIVRDFENKRIILPNSVISNEIIENHNIGDEKIRKFINVSISYDSDLNKAIKIIQKESEKHPLSIDQRSDEEKSNKIPMVDVKVVNLGNSSVDLRAYVWTKGSVAAFLLSCDLKKSIKESFDKSGIEIPYPHRTVIMKN